MCNSKLAVLVMGFSPSTFLRKELLKIKMKSQTTFFPPFPSEYYYIYIFHNFLHLLSSLLISLYHCQASTHPLSRSRSFQWRAQSKIATRRTSHLPFLQSKLLTHLCTSTARASNAGSLLLESLFKTSPISLIRHFHFIQDLILCFLPFSVFSSTNQISERGNHF